MRTDTMLSLHLGTEFSGHLTNWIQEAFNLPLMLNILPYPIKEGTQYLQQHNLNWGIKVNKNLLFNAPLGFRKFQKVRGSGGKILVVSGGGEWDISPEITNKKKNISQGFLEKALPRFGEHRRCYIVMNEYLLAAGHL